MICGFCNPGDFDGLSEGLRKAAMAQAREKFKCLGVIGNTRSFVESLLTLAITGSYTKFGEWCQKG
jgi:hypothetical protein